MSAKTKRTPKPGGKGSTKPRFDTTKEAAFLKELRENRHGRMMSAKAIGVDPSTVRRHIALSPSFATAVSEAEIEAEKEKIEEVEDALHQAAIGGNVTAIQVFLYNRHPDRWSDRRKTMEIVARPNASGDGSVSFYLPTNGR